MLICAISGSPNKDGNTVLLLNEALAAARDQGADCAMFYAEDLLAGCETPFCTACSSPCSGICYEGTALERFFEVCEKADGILLGSPVYFGTVSAQLKAVWDKTRRLRADKVLLNVVGGVVTVGGSRFGGQETTVKAIMDMMLIQGMIIVGDGHRDSDCGTQGASAQSPASEDETGRTRARILGRRIVEVARATEHIRLR